MMPTKAHPLKGFDARFLLRSLEGGADRAGDTIMAIDFSGQPATDLPTPSVTHHHMCEYLCNTFSQLVLPLVNTVVAHAGSCVLSHFDVVFVSYSSANCSPFPFRGGTLFGTRPQDAEMTV